MKKTLAVVAAAVILLMTASPAKAIVNGDFDMTHNYVGKMRKVDQTVDERFCSGSYIGLAESGEGVFLTAGHCTLLAESDPSAPMDTTDPGIELLFGDDVAAAGPSTIVLRATKVLHHPQFNDSFGKQFDVGVVLFDTADVVLPSPGEVAQENFVDGLSLDRLNAATFQVVGYGLHRDKTTGNSGPLLLDGRRRFATQGYRNKHNQFLGLSINNNQGNGGACHGDSGGPHLLEDDNEKEVIVSVSSNGDVNCVATDNTQRVDQPEIRDWILSFVSED